MAQENIPPSSKDLSFVPGYLRSTTEITELMRLAQSQSKDDMPTQPLMPTKPPRKARSKPTKTLRPPLQPLQAQSVPQPSAPDSPVQIRSVRILAPVISCENGERSTTQTIETPYATINIVNHLPDSLPAATIPQHAYAYRQSPNSPPPIPKPSKHGRALHANISNALHPVFGQSMSSDMDGVLDAVMGAASLKRPASIANLDTFSTAKRCFSGTPSFNCSSDTDEAEPNRQLEHDIWGECDDEDLEEAAAAFERDLAAVGQSTENKEDFTRLIQSIPLDEAPKDEVDLSETVVVKTPFFADDN
jgi:hypothetical protein